MAVTRGAKRKAETSLDPLGTTAPDASVCDGLVIDLTSEDEDWSESMEKGSGRGQKKRRTKAVKPKLSQKQAKEEGGNEEQKEPDKQDGETCGICLSEEVQEQGKLDCCDHFFCFQCIMEWGKVESRCPMCKQRFASIVRPPIGGIPRSRKKTVRVPERNQVYEPTAEEIIAMMAPQTDIMCQYCSDVVDEGQQLVCNVCETTVAHDHCAATDGSLLDWTCRYCSHVDIDHEFDGFGVLSSMMNIFEQPRRARRHERASFFFPSFPASRSSRRAGVVRRAIGSTSGAASLARRSLAPRAHLFLEALSASIAEPAISTSPTPASVLAPAWRSRGIPRVSRPAGVRAAAAAGSSARRPILISPEVINVEDDDEVPSAPNAVSYSDISRAWTLADQARSQLATNERVRPSRNTGRRSMRRPPSPPAVTPSEAVSPSTACQAPEGRRGLSIRRVSPVSMHSHRSSNGSGETMSLMNNLGGAVMDRGEPLHEAQTRSGPSIMLRNSLQASSMEGGQPHISADREKKKEVTVVDLEEPSGSAAEFHAGFSGDWYETMLQSSGFSPMEETPSPYGRHDSIRELKCRIRELVKAELDPYYRSEQIGRETFKKFAKEATRTLHLAMMGGSDECNYHVRGPESSSRAAASCCNQCLTDGVKQHVGDLITPYLFQQNCGNLFFSSRSTAY